MLHAIIIGPTCFYHIEPLSWDQLANQRDWLLTVSDLLYGFHPISLNIPTITLLKRPFIKIESIRSRVTL